MYQKSTGLCFYIHVSSHSNWIQSLQLCFCYFHTCKVYRLYTSNYNSGNLCRGWTGRQVGSVWSSISKKNVRMTFEWWSLCLLWSAITPTVAPSVALADDTGGPNQRTTRWRIGGQWRRTILTLPSEIILSAVCIAQNWYLADSYLSYKDPCPTISIHKRYIHVPWVHPWPVPTQLLRWCYIPPTVVSLYDYRVNAHGHGFCQRANAHGHGFCPGLKQTRKNAKPSLKIQLSFSLNFGNEAF